MADGDGVVDGGPVADLAVCPNCDGHGGGWPENPMICGGLRCVWCNGVCAVCLGSDDPTTWVLDSMQPSPPAPSSAGGSTTLTTGNRS